MAKASATRIIDGLKQALRYVRCNHQWQRKVDKKGRTSYYCARCETTTHSVRVEKLPEL